MKTCSKCHISKPLEEFSLDKSRKDGHQVVCKMCGAKYHREHLEHVREYRNNNRNQIKEYRKNYRATHQKQIKEYKIEYCSKNGERLKLQAREYARSHKEKLSAQRRARSQLKSAYFKEYNKKYRQEHPDYFINYRIENAERIKESRTRRLKDILAYNTVRKTKVRSNGGKFTAWQWELIKTYYAPDGRCPACGELRPLTVDHVVPIKMGGTSNPDNLQPLCLKCNCSKNATVKDYRFDHGKYCAEITSMI
jgi:5-methylcytosine-specific restriction endonuclease McrA